MAAAILSEREAASMNGERWQRVEELFHQAADLPPSERSPFLDHACAGDADLKDEVDSLLGHDATLETDDLEVAVERTLVQLPGGGDGVSGDLVGKRLGPYTITELIGRGGMGHVFKAVDTRLNRFVAIKALSPGHFAEDPKTKRRFAEEAMSLSALNHPNIVTIFGLMEEAGTDFIIMEYVSGKTLDRLIPPAGMPLKVVLSYAVEVADALSAAHAAGLIHRDVKPSNIIVSDSGHVKVLDFGASKRMVPRGLANLGGPSSETPQQASPPALQTEAGFIIGTAAYMSPEQAQGQTLDARSDIFSFGVLLYEMIAGTRPFQGDSQMSTLAAVLREEPKPLAEIAPFASPELTHVVTRCLRKDPARRVQGMADLKVILEEMRNESGSHQVLPQPAPLPERAAPPRLLPTFTKYWAAAFLTVVAALSWWLYSRESPPKARSVVRTTINLPGNTFVIPVVSPDGTRMLYSGVGIPPRLWLRKMDELDGHPIAGADGGDWGTFSPDGQSIAFLKGPAPHKLMKVSLTDGTPVELSSEPDLATVPSWTDDGFILVGSSRGVVRVPASGGKSELLTTANHKNGEMGHQEPVQLPRGRGVLFSVVNDPTPELPQSNTSRIAILDLKSRSYQVLPGTGSAPRYVPTGHLVYRRGSTLFAVPFDADHLSVTGPETAVLEGLASSATPYTFSQSGLLIYRSQVGSQNSRDNTTLAWIDRKGAVESLPEPPHQWSTIPLSPDGSRVVGDLLEAGASPGNERMWIYDTNRGVLAPVTSGKGDHHPIWTPDGRSIVFASNRGGKYGIFRIPADSSGQPELLLATDTIPYPWSWTPDGNTLAYYQFDGKPARILLLPTPRSTGGVGNPSRFHPGATSSELQPTISPDGKWLAYTSDHSGQFEIYVAPFPGPGGMFQISTRGGRQPRWLPNGRELFYVERDPRRLMAVSISPGPVFQAGRPEALFTIRNDAPFFSYDVAPDGKRFLVLMRPQGASASVSQSTFVVVTEWFEELLLRAPIKK